MSLHLSLIAASNTCSAALQSLAAVHCARPSPPPLPVLRNDLSSLLSLLRLTTVKSALAFNDSAALTPINDLSAHIDALVHCARLFSPDVHGATLTKEVVSTITVVVEAVAALVHSFLAGGEVYMVRVGEVHDLIDKAMEMSKDNLAAVRKRWADDRATLDDAFRELGEMLEGGDGDQDGWDELGLGSKMDENELERAKQVHTLLRLTTLLHKRILLDLIVPSSATVLDALPHHSTALLTSTDDLISTLYAPQNLTSIRAELTSFIDTIRALQSGLAAGGLEVQLGQMSIQDSGGGKTKKWFDTCFQQIYKLAASVDNKTNPIHTPSSPPPSS